MRLTCRDDGCTCRSHVDTRYFVPCCPFCRVPLIGPDPPEPVHAVCPLWRCAGYGRLLPADEWAWLHQDTFAAEDLPPFNGWRPIDLRGVV